MSFITSGSTNGSWSAWMSSSESSIFSTASMPASSSAQSFNVSEAIPPVIAVCEKQRKKKQIILWSPRTLKLQRESFCYYFLLPLAPLRFAPFARRLTWVSVAAQWVIREAARDALDGAFQFPSRVEALQLLHRFAQMLLWYFLSVLQRHTRVASAPHGNNGKGRRKEMGKITFNHLLVAVRLPRKSW